MGRLFNVLQQHTLGELEFEQMGVDLVRSDRRPHLIDKIGLPKLSCTDIDREEQLIRARVFLPGFKPDTRLLEDPTADWDHQSGFFGELNKTARSH